MKRCAIISGGAYAPLTDIGKCEYVAACDKGYEYALQDGVHVDLLIADFDSYQGEVSPDLEVIALPGQKDDTDTLHAYREIIRRGFDQVYLYCALGGRLDHLYANIQCAVYGAKEGVETYFIDEQENIIVSNAGQIVLPRKEGYSLSVFAADLAEHVSIENAFYELADERLVNSFPLGQSNEWLDGDVLIRKGEGVLIIIESKLNNK